MNLEMTAARSYRNCHAHGLDCLVLDDTPGARVRMFIAHPNHTLWQNQVPIRYPMRMGLHGHHCHLDVASRAGEIWIVETCSQEHAQDILELRVFRHLSSIGFGVGRFKETRMKAICPLRMRRLEAPRKLHAWDLHSIYVPRGDFAAWLVREGKEDPHYRPLCWSNDNLENIDWTNLYQSMSVEYLRWLLDALRRHGVEREQLAQHGLQNGSV